MFQMIRVTALSTTQHAVGFAPLHHEGCNHSVVHAHEPPGFVHGDALAPHNGMIVFPVISVSVILLRVAKLKIVIHSEAQTKLF